MSADEEIAACLRGYPSPHLIGDSYLEPLGYALSRYAETPRAYRERLDLVLVAEWAEVARRAARDAHELTHRQARLVAGVPVDGDSAGKLQAEQRDLARDLSCCTAALCIFPELPEYRDAAEAHRGLLAW